jgi:hypothetical protein
MILRGCILAHSQSTGRERSQRVTEADSEPRNVEELIYKLNQLREEFERLKKEYENHAHWSYGTGTRTGKSVRGNERD